MTVLLLSLVSLVFALFGTAPAAAQSCPQGWFGGTFVPPVSPTMRALVEWSPQGDPNKSLLVTAHGPYGSATGGVYAWDGTRWLGLASELDGAVVDLCVYQGDLIAAGLFQHIGGIAARGIARFDGTRWHALAEPSTLHLLGAVSVRVLENDLVVAGTFQRTGQPQYLRVARHRNGDWQAMDAANFSVRSPYFLRNHQNELFMFSNNGFNDYTDVSRWDGTKWAHVQYLAVRVTDAESFEGELFVACDRAVQFPGFVSAIGAWNGSSWRSLASPGLVYQAYLLCTYQGALHAHLSQVVAGDDLRVISRLDGQTWTVLQSMYSSASAPVHSDLGSWRNKLCTLNIDGPVRPSIVESGNLTPITFPALPLQNISFAAPDGDGRAFVSTTNSSPASTYTAQLWDGSQVTPLGSILTGDIRAFARNGNALYIGGNFIIAGSASVKGVAQFDGTDWRPMANTIPGNVEALCMFRGELHAAGSYRLIGTNINRIARWDGSAWNPLGAGVGPTNAGGARINAMCVYNDRLIVGGSFTVASGVAVTNVASWDGTNWTPMGSIGSFVDYLFVHRGELLAIRKLRGIDSIARWNGAQWVTIAPSIQDVESAFPHEGRIAVLARYGLAFIDNPDGSDVEFHGIAYATSTLRPMISAGNKLQLVGSANAIDGLTIPLRAEWSELLPPTILREPTDAHACAGRDTTLRIGAIDPLPLSYRWEKDGVPVVDGPHYAGATTPELRLLDARKGMIGSYRCVVSRACAEVQTALAHVGVCYADFNCDGLVNDADFQQFLAAYTLLEVPPAEAVFDQNEDGVVDDADFELFVLAYNRCDCHDSAE